MQYKKGINESQTEDTLNKFAHIIPMLSLVNQLNDNSTSTFRTPEEFEQEYGWNYENTTDDYFVVREDDNTIDPMYDEENLDENVFFWSGTYNSRREFLRCSEAKDIWFNAS